MKFDCQTAKDITSFPNGSEGIGCNSTPEESQINISSVEALNRYWSNQYKAYCIDFYLKRFKCDIISTEIRYGIAQLVTDLVIVTPKNTVSIEIKTEQDDLRRLLRQTSEALKVFNLVIVFLSSKHAEEAIKILPEKVGITVLSDRDSKVIRGPRRQTPNPAEIYASIPAAFIRNFFKIDTHMDSDKLRQQAVLNHPKEANACFRCYLQNKYCQNYNQFLADRGQATHIEDIPILNMKTEVELK